MAVLCEAGIHYAEEGALLTDGMVVRGLTNVFAGARYSSAVDVLLLTIHNGGSTMEWHGQRSREGGCGRTRRIRSGMRLKFKFGPWEGGGTSAAPSGPLASAHFTLLSLHFREKGKVGELALSLPVHQLLATSPPWPSGRLPAHTGEQSWTPSAGHHPAQHSVGLENVWTRSRDGHGEGEAELNLALEASTNFSDD